MTALQTPVQAGFGQGFRLKLPHDADRWELGFPIWSVLDRRILSSQAAANPVLLEPIFLEIATLAGNIFFFWISQLLFFFWAAAKLKARLEGIQQGGI